MRFYLQFAVALILTAACGQLAFAGPITVYTDAPEGSGGDFTDRGFYITGYSANNLGTVTLYYDTDDLAGGTFQLSLTANLNAYDGTMIGSTQTQTFDLVGGESNELAVVFDFGGAAVAPGSTITFTQNVITGPGSLFYDIGTPGPSGVSETEGTTPPLDVFRRSQVATTITADTLAAPEPSSLVLFAAGLALVVRLRVRG